MGCSILYLSGHLYRFFRMKFDCRDVVIYEKVLNLDIEFCC